MNLTLLHQDPGLTVYHDSWNHWLFLDWQGALTLPGVQQASLSLLGCCPYPYQRILNSNAGVTHVPDEVVAWLERELVPLLELVGVEQIAWVPASGAEGQHLVARAQRWPLRVAAFDDLEAAVAWLQDTGPQVPAAVRQALERAQQQANAPHTQRFAERVAEQLADVVGT